MNQRQVLSQFRNIYTRGLPQRCSVPHFLLILLSGVAVSLVGCSLPRNLLQTPKKDGLVQAQPENKTDISSSSAPPAIFSASGDPNFVVGVVQKVGGAVVRIDASKTVKTEVPEELEDPFLKRFFGEGSAEPRQRVERGSGSGFIINSTGQIVTNSHVVNGADVVTVILKDGRQFNGKVMGEDPVTDVAVIKIESDNLPAVPLGNSDVLQPGEAVIAIGNPLGLNNTVTSGIISATGRSSSDIGASDKRVDYLQTDAAINPGNSGGPLLNASGQVIGMNTAIIKGAQGLGFAIPMKTVQRIAEQLIAKGRVDHPYLGIQMLTLTPEVRERINSRFGDRVNITTDKGILLVDVVPRSPAASAGLKQGDVIRSINNQNVTKIEEVQKIVESSQIGNPLQIQVERNGQTTQIPVKPAPLPSRREG
jgi:serine protease Do